MRSLLNEMAAVEIEAENSVQMGNSISSVEDIVLSNGSDSKKEGTTLEIDPDFQKLLPILPQEAIDGLRQSIQKDGCTDPIIVWKNKGILLDGHNRLQICTELGIPYTIKEIEFETKDDAAKWIIARQINRRNLNIFQRIEASLSLYGEYFQDLAKKNRREGASRGGKAEEKAYQDLDTPSKPIHTNVEIAKLARTNPDYVSRVRSLLKEPIKNALLIEKLRQGQMTIDATRFMVDRNKKKDERDNFNRQNLLFENRNEVIDAVINADVIDGLRKIPDGKVSLIFTSIPYNNDLDYGRDLNGNLIIDNRPWAEYCQWLTDVFTEHKRVLRPGARCVINCDSISTRDEDEKGMYYKRPIIKDICNIMEKVGLLYRDEICWVKTNVGSKKSRWGSWLSASCPAIRREHEYLLVFSKDQWDLPNETGMDSDLTDKEFIELTNSVWELPAETHPYFPHPAAFPVSLAERVIKLFSFPGDWVVDCFAGTFTTCVAAARLHRHYTGIDCNTNYCAKGKERIEEELANLNPMKNVA